MFELNQAGYSSVAMNFRGCGSRLNRQKRFYHSGETSDYQTLFKWISESFPGSLIYAVGFSLGGNALIKSLGELRDQHPVTKAVAVSPPYDLKLGSYNLQKGFNRIYESRFMQTLRLKLEQKKALYPDLPSFNGTTIFAFDDEVTAPVHGFKDAVDYYDSCSSKGFLDKVDKPLLLIHSESDTLTPLRFAPFKVIEKNPNIDTIFTKNGGHVGFITKPRNWLEKTIVSWLNE
jgi:predicted alpha/beta-fold hydrolase